MMNYINWSVITATLILKMPLTYYNKKWKLNKLINVHAFQDNINSGHTVCFFMMYFPPGIPETALPDNYHNQTVLNLIL